jgi:hypothetical protein
MELTKEQCQTVIDMYELLKAQLSYEHRVWLETRGKLNEFIDLAVTLKREVRRGA